VTSSDSGINFFVARYRSEGGLQWYRTYATMEMDIANDIVVDDSCNIYALGTINAAPHTSDIIVVKYDSSGRMAWNRLVDGDRSDNDAGIRIIRDDSSRCIVTGYMNRSGDRSDIPVILIDTKGEVVKQRLSYGGTSDCLVQNMSFYHDTLQLTAMYLDYATQRTGYQLIEFSGSLNPLFFRESDPGELNFGMITSGENRLMLSALVNEEEGTLRPFFRIPSTDSLPDYRWVDNEVNGIVYIRQVLVSENAVYYLCDDASEATGTLSIMRYDLDPEYRRPDQPRKSDVNRNKSFLPRR
jgi:hypothetical protein